MTGTSTTTQVAEIAQYAYEKLLGSHLHDGGTAPGYQIVAQPQMVFEGITNYPPRYAHIVTAAHIAIRVWDDDTTVHAMLADRHGNGVGPEMTFTGLPSWLAADAVVNWADNAEEIIRTT